MKKVIFFMVCLFLFVSCNNQTKKKDAEESVKNNIEESVEDNVKIIDAKKQFLIENGFNEDADISEADIKYVKEWQDAGTFDKISICQAFYELLPMGDKEGTKYMKKFKLPKGKTIDDLSIFLNFTARSLCYKYPKPREPKSKEEIESLFSKIDGTLPDLVDKVKSQMKNPSSFEHIKTSYKDIKTRLIIKMEYSGLNSFNARVNQEVTATSDYSGKVLTIYKNE